MQLMVMVLIIYHLQISLHIKTQHLIMQFMDQLVLTMLFQFQFQFPVTMELMQLLLLFINHWLLLI